MANCHANNISDYTEGCDQSDHAGAFGFAAFQGDSAQYDVGDQPQQFRGQPAVSKRILADLEHQAGLMAVAQKDARLLLQQDPDLSTPRGHAARVLLWLMRQDEAIRLISVG